MANVITRKIRAETLRVGDIFSYCGATYQVVIKDEPDDFGMMFMSVVKRRNGVIVSTNFHMARHVDDVINMLY